MSSLVCSSAVHAQRLVPMNVLAFADTAGVRFEVRSAQGALLTGATVTVKLTSTGDNEDPSWAPDGRHIVFSSGVGDQQLSLYVIDAVSKKRRLLTGGSGKLRMSDWSPILARASDYVIN